MNRAILALLQRRADLLGPHGFHFPGNTGHQHGAMALFILKPGTGGGAVVVDDLMPPGGDHSLFAVIGGGIAVGAGEKGNDLVPFFLIKVQGIPECLGDCFLRQVILGRPQPARKHQQIAAAAGLAHQFPQPFGIIPDHMLMQDADAQFRQFPAQELGVGVDDVPQQQFRTYTNDFCSHSRSSSPIRMAIFSTCSAASVSRAFSSGIPSSAARISASVGLVLGWGGVKIVQQSS